MNGELCRVCDRPDGWKNDPHPYADCPLGDDGACCVVLCWGGYQCRDAAVDWRARSIAAGVERDAALCQVAVLRAALEFMGGDE